MKKILTILLALTGMSMTNLSTAQAQTIVKGMLVDSLTQEGEPFASVRIYSVQSMQNPNTQPIATVLSDTEGKFSTKVAQQGNFVAVCASMGKNPVMRPFNVKGEKEIDLGTLVMSDKTSVMQSVEIQAQKPIVKMEADKMTYSVEDDVESRTLTILDMLRKVPMVTVDGQDNISVNGSGSFKVYVDGKPNMMLSSNPSQILKAMPASMVSSIEVVTNPGAKYDAEGAAGILNINMAKMNGAAGAGAAQQMNGGNGSVTANGGNRGAGVSASVAGQHNKLTYNVNASYQYINNGDVDVEMLREQNDGTKTLYTQTSRNTVPFYMGSVGLGYEVDDRSQLNAQFGVTRFQVTNSGNPTTTISGGTLPQPFSYTNYMRNKIGNTDFNGSVDYQRFLDDKKQSHFTLTYQIDSKPGTNDSETTFEGGEVVGNALNLNSRVSEGKDHTTEHVGQFDLVNKLTEHSTLNSGLKYAYRTSTADMDYYQIIKGNKTYLDDMSSDYEHTNQIGAAYVESENRWANWTAKAGLRYEHTWQNVIYHSQNGKDFKKNYGNLVPSASTSFTIKPGQSIGANYNMRISRPGITYLNPYVDRSESTSLTYGNPNLEVEKTHNVSMVYNLYTPKLVLNATLSEAIANGGIEQYSFYKTDDMGNKLLNTTYGNIVDRRITSLNIFASWSMTKTTRVVVNGGASYTHLNSDELGYTNSGWSGKAMLNVQQTLPKSWIVSATVISNSKTYTLQGWNSGMNLGVLSLSKSLLKDRLNLSLNGVTGLAKGGKLLINQHSEGKDFTSSFDISVPVTRVMFTARWTFGNTKKNFTKHETNVKDDYIEHQSSSESIGNAGSM